MSAVTLISTMHMRNLFASVGASTVFAAAATGAHAAVIFDTISGATFTSAHHRVGEYPAFSGETNPHSFRVATRISIAGDGFWRLDAIGARVSRDGDYLGAGRARMWISEVIDGTGPTDGVALGNIATTSTSATNVALEGLASLNVTLQGGKSYWITLSAIAGDPDDTRLRWYRSSLGAGGTTFVDDLLTPEGFATAEGNAGGLKLVATAVPAPSVILPCVAALASATLRRSRRA